MRNENNAYSAKSAAPIFRTDLIVRLGHSENVRRTIYRWDRQGHKGQTCRVTARGKFNSIRRRICRWLCDDHQRQRDPSRPTHFGFRAYR